MRPINYYGKIVGIFQCLKKEHPQYSIGKHISTALDGYDIWGMSDKSVYEALSRYEAELQFDIPHDTTNDKDIDIIVSDGINLNRLREQLYEDEEEY